MPKPWLKNRETELMVNTVRESMNYWRSRSTNVEQSSQDGNHTNAVPDSFILIENIPFESTIEDLAHFAELGFFNSKEGFWLKIV